MKNELLGLLTAIHSGKNQRKLCEDVENFFTRCGTDFISENKKEIAELFFQYLCAMQNVFGENAHKDGAKSVLKVFREVEHINTDARTQNVSDSNMMTVLFLSQLYCEEENEYNTGVDSEILNEEVVEKLLDCLEDIHFIFRIKVKEQIVFPINRLISSFLKSPEFLGVKKISSWYIHILQLAVELFQHSHEDEMTILNDIQKRCNLSFLKYDGKTEIIDSKDMINYQKNGVMIFYNASNQKVIIRHEKQEYFNSCVNCKISYVDGVEKNYNGKEIGYFCEYDAKGFELINYETLIQKNPKKLLKLLYEENCYNIFMESMIIKTKLGEYFPINPFCVNDRKIVTGKIGKESYAQVYTMDNFLQVLSRFRLECIEGCGINRVTFGLCCSLLQEDKMSIDTLFSDISGDDWLQNVVIRKWVENGTGNYKKLSYILGKWILDLEYCSTKKGIEEYEIGAKDLYPLALQTDWIYSLIGLKVKEHGILKVQFQEEYDGEVVFLIDEQKTLAGKRYKGENLAMQISKEKINFCEEIHKDEYCESGVEHYLIYDFNEESWMAFDKEKEGIFRLLAYIEKIQECSTLHYSIMQALNEAQIRKLTDLMKLHKDVLLNSVERYFYTFESMAVYRLIHNMIWSEITAEKWKSYYNIFENHQRLSFADIDSDEYFSMKEKNVLYVPKDNAEKDAVLYRVFQHYLDRGGAERHKNEYLYNRQIGIKEDKYYTINDVKIEKIIFLFDNFERGKSTQDTLALYLEHEDKFPENWNEKTKEKRQKSLQSYLCNKNEIFVKDIIDKNGISKFEVHSYYGTDEGKRNIENFLKECGYCDATVSFKETINSKSNLISKECNEIWKKNIESKDFFIVIREFNLTKKNAFPDEMIKNPERAICLFIKKEE